MTKEVKQTALRIRQALRPAEAISDATLGRIGLAIHTACEARSSLNVSSSASHAVLDKLARAAVQQVETSRTLIEAHEAAAQLYGQAFPEVAIGDHGCPPMKALIETSEDGGVVHAIRA